MKTPKHILVIRLSALGDVAMTVPILRVLVATYPELRITVLSRKQFEPLFSNIPNVNFKEAEVKGKHKGFFGLWRLAKEVKRLGIDHVADLHNVIRSKVVTRVLSFSGIPSVTLDKGRQEKKKLTNAKGMGLVKLKSMHQRYADVFASLNIPIDLSAHQFPEREKLTPRLLTLIGTEPKKCIGIAPFAAYSSKMYPLGQMKEVIQELDVLGDYKIMLFGGGAEEEKQLKELASQFTSVTNVAGTLTFEEELALISNLDLMLAMDSANGHLAAMYGVPVVTLWGVTHPYAGFVPFNQPDDYQLMADRNQFPMIPTSVYGNKYPEGYEDAMKSVPSERVVQKLREIL
ncbi:glycosyltransferase family 9 protein [Aureisphaera galaxeae]|uniref:glycosyltransferase family 9 protein n=1 Tax=Aureisphaera galaxeae TaxID=1538023 RepID=UPI00234FE472|nr:glycosyltransferase family 9 protein [Aureisphaera galaxeae]MDC8005059.1 glycosyltransferase family 9 protein [Aureisphaera galaxeae]